MKSMMSIVAVTASLLHFSSTRVGAKPAHEGVSEFLCVRLVQSHPPLGERL